MELTHSTALVTGASSGIGAATARALAAEGARVVLAARRTDRLQELVDLIEGDGGSALAVSTDVTDRDAVLALAQAALDRFGSIDVLVNNAGVMPLTYLKNMRTADWYQTVDVNLMGVLYAIEAVLPSMLENRRGHVVNVSSTWGRSVDPGSSVYSATKYAVRALSDGMRQELGPSHGIKVTCVEPGAVSTELFGTVGDEEVKRDLAGSMDGVTFLEPEDIARAIDAMEADQ